MVLIACITQQDSPRDKPENVSQKAQYRSLSKLIEASPQFPVQDVSRFTYRNRPQKLRLGIDSSCVSRLNLLWFTALVKGFGSYK
jgi:hypothetical protein